jgi:hypothetical protein
MWRRPSGVNHNHDPFAAINRCAQRCILRLSLTEYLELAALLCSRNSGSKSAARSRTESASFTGYGYDRREQRSNKCSSSQCPHAPSLNKKFEEAVLDQIQEQVLSEKNARKYRSDR